MANTTPVLRSGESRLVLERRTTIGRQGCDINLPFSAVERRHAVIEAQEQAPGSGGMSVLLTDLNSSQGTYVNESRVQNATVRLAHGDVVQFGHGTPAYRYELETGQSTASPALPEIPGTRSSTSSYVMRTPGRVVGTPTPPTHSGTGARAVPLARPTGRGVAPLLSMSAAEASLAIPTSPMAAMTEREKSEKLLRMGDEISRLAVFENECRRKDNIIADLRQHLSNSSATAEASTKTVEQLTATLKNLQAAKETETSRMITFRDQAELVPGLRKEITQRRQTYNGVADERKRLQQDVASLEKTAGQLRKELADKTASAGMLRSELTLMRTHRAAAQKEIEDLRQCLAVQETLADDRATAVARLVKEVDSLKGGVARAGEVNKEMERARIELANERRHMRRKEAECDALSEQLKAFIKNVVLHTREPVDGSDSDADESDSESQEMPMSVSTAMFNLKKAMADKQSYAEQLEALHKEHRETDSSRTAMGLFLAGLHNCLDFNPQDSSASDMQEKLQRIHDLEPPEDWESLKTSLASLMEYTVGAKADLLDLTSSVTSAADLLGNIEVRTDPVVIVKQLQQKLTDLTEETKDLQNHLVHARQEHEQSVGLLTTALRREANADRTAAVTECQAQIDAATQAAVAQTLAESRVVEADLAKKIRALEQALDTATVDCREREQLVESTKLELQESNRRTNALQVKLNGEPERTAAACNEVRKLCQADMSKHLELNKQHGLTIVSQERRLAAASEERTQLQTQLELQTAAAKHGGVSQRGKTRTFSRGRSTTSPTLRSAGVPGGGGGGDDDDGSPADDDQVDADACSTESEEAMSRQRLLSEVDGLKRLLDVSRHDTSGAQAKLREANSHIYSLRRDLAGASAQLADMRVVRDRESVDIERRLKQELNQKHEVVQRQIGEISALKEAGERQRADVAAQLAETQYVHQLLDASHGVESDQRQELRQARQQWQSGVRAHREEVAGIKEKHQKAFSLAEIGARCQAQNHDRTVRDQSAALASLRRGGPQAGPSDDSSQSEDVWSLQQQLREAKTQLALQMTSSLATPSELKASRSLAAKSESEIVRNQMEAERESQRDLLSALEESEKTYCSLVRSVVRSLEIEPLQGTRSVIGLTRQQRAPVMADRSKIQETLASRIAAIREKVRRKESLLESYEEDLAKLRRFEMDSLSKTAKLSSLERDVSGKAREVNMLRESVHRVQEELDQQMRLNASLRTRQVFKESQSRQHAPPSHSCLLMPSEVDQKLSTQKRGFTEQLRRKDLELKSLKQDLVTTDSHLQAALSQLGTSTP